MDQLSSSEGSRSMARLNDRALHGGLGRSHFLSIKSFCGFSSQGRNCLLLVTASANSNTLDYMVGIPIAPTCPSHASFSS